MLGSTGLVGSSGEGGSSAHEGGGGGGGEILVGSSGSSSIMSSGGGGIGDDEKGRGGAIELFEGDRSSGGNRWPRQETIALLQIRSDMDNIFRDSSLKGPLWEEVSRKMAELGYHRSAKKCKEKFENVYKYHKRTKDGRVGKADGKTYRFFDQLEALEQIHHSSSGSSSHLPPLPPATPRAQSQPPAQAAVPVSMVMPAGTNPATVTVPSSPHPPHISILHTSSASASAPAPTPAIAIATTIPQHQQMNVVNTTNQIPQVIQQHQQQHHQHQPIMSVHHSPIQMENTSSPSATPSSSSSTSSDEELLGRRKRKRKWKDFFERLMKEVIDKQEELQKRFLEAVEKREHDRLVREEAWKMQEMARLNREHEILVQERSMAAAKDAALIAFLQKLSDQQQIPLSLPVQVQSQPQPQTQTQIQAQAQAQTQVRAAVPVVTSTTTTTPQPKPQPQPQPQPQPLIQPQTQVVQVHGQETPVALPPPAQPQPLHPQPLAQIMPPPQQQQALVVANTNNTNMELQKMMHNGESQLQASSSRWPKAEVQALINLRTKLDQKYQENGPKGPLWEEISASMKKIGYNRNAKRCKEKWENINKYFKKVKESNKKRPEDSKTCPYFHQLDALYREKNKMEISNINPNNNNNNPSYPTPNNNNPAYPQQQQQMKPENLNTMGPIMTQPEQQWPLQPGPDQDMEDPGSDSDDDADEEDDDDQGSGYEIVANNAGGSMSATTTTTTATAE